MARRQPQKKFQLETLWKNNTLLGFICGLVSGLVIAVIIAIIITRSPMPFNSSVAKKGKTPAKTSVFADPNQPMYNDQDIAKNALKKSADETEIISDGTNSDEAEIPTNYLQVGAYHDKKEAENMQARLALLGMEAYIREGKSQNRTLFRVQLGPYTQKKLADTKNKLKDLGIEFTTIRS